MGLCSQCLAKGLAILPFRHALLPAKFLVDERVSDDMSMNWRALPAKLKMPAWANFEFDEESFGDDARPGLRSLRGGYLYVYYPSAKLTANGVVAQWEAYTVNPSGIFSLSATGADSPAPPSSVIYSASTPCATCQSPPIQKTGHIVIVEPEECDEAYIAFSEHKWTSATRRRVAENPGARMLKLSPSEIIGKTAEGSSGKGWINSSLDEIVKALEFCPEVNFFVLAKQQGLDTFLRARKPVDPAIPAVRFWELTAYSRYGTGAASGSCGQHDPEVLRTWSSVSTGRFQCYLPSEFEGNNRQLGGELLGNNSYEVPAERPKSQWAATLLDNFLVPMRGRHSKHPGIMVALDDALGMALDINSYFNQIPSRKLQYEIERQSEIAAMNAIDGLPQAVAYKLSSMPMELYRYKKREQWVSASAKPPHTFQVAREEYIEHGMHYTVYDTYYQVIQSPKEALAEARRGGWLADEMYGVKNYKEYKAKAKKLSAEPMEEKEYLQRRYWLNAAAKVSVEEKEITISSEPLDPMSPIPSYSTSRITYYIVEQTDDLAVQEAQTGGPLMEKMFRDHQGLFESNQDIADYMQEVDHARLGAFKENLKKFQDDQEFLLDDRAQALVNWLESDRLIAVLDDYDVDSSVVEEKVACCDAIEDLIHGMEASDVSQTLFNRWANRKITGKKNLLVRLMSYCNKQYFGDVDNFLGFVQENKKTKFTNIALVNPASTYMKAPADFYRKQMAAHIHNFLATSEKMGGGGSQIPVPGTKGTIQPIGFQSNKYIFELSGKLLKWTRMHEAVDSLGANAIYKFLLNGWLQDQTVIDELVGKNTTLQLDEDLRSSKEIAKDVAAFEADRLKNAQEKFGTKTPDGKKWVSRQEQLTSRGAGLAIIVGTVELYRLKYLLSIAYQKGELDWKLSRQIIGNLAIISSCILDLFGQVARMRELPLEQARTQSFFSPRYMRNKVGSGVLGGTASLLALWTDIENINAEYEDGTRKAFLYSRAALDGAQAIASLYVAASFSTRIAVRFAALRLGSFLAYRVVGMLLGPVGIVLSILIEIAIYKSSDDEVENWIEKCAFGKYRSTDWLKDPDRQDEAFYNAMAKVGLQTE